MKELDNKTSFLLPQPHSVVVCGANRKPMFELEIVVARWLIHILGARARRGFVSFTL